MTGAAGGEKKRIRYRMKELLYALSPGDRRRYSRLIARRLAFLPAYRHARYLMFYIGVGWEIDTLPMIFTALGQGKIVVVPVCRPATRNLIASRLESLKDLQPGFYGLLEPAFERIRPLDPRKLELVVVPGLAFDRRGNRLGRGGGYYDRFLAGLGPRTVLAALAFEFQVIEKVPVLEYDWPVDWIITPRETIRCRSSREDGRSLGRRRRI